MNREALIERLAAIEHERWEDWQSYLHGKCDKGPVSNRIGDGFGSCSLMIPAGYVANLGRQIETPYADLSDSEKQSDREQVMRYWPVIVEFVVNWMERDGDFEDEAVERAARWYREMQP